MKFNVDLISAETHCSSVVCIILEISLLISARNFQNRLMHFHLVAGQMWDIFETQSTCIYACIDAFIVDSWCIVANGITSNVVCVTSEVQYGQTASVDDILETCRRNRVILKGIIASPLHSEEGIGQTLNMKIRYHSSSIVDLHLFVEIK